MEKVAPSERFRAELDEVLAGVGEEHDPVELVGRLGARLILQRALEDEVTEFLGRRRYEWAEETVGHRNGHEPKTIKTTRGGRWTWSVRGSVMRASSALRAGCSARAWPARTPWSRW